MKKILLDIDGCITDGKGQPIDLVALQKLKQLIYQLEAEQHITTALCTGRSALYVEAIAQMLAIQGWCICENGAYLYHTVTEAMIFHPNVTTASRQHLQKIKQRLTTETQLTSVSKIELGKEVCISLNPVGNVTIEALYELIKSHFNLSDLHIAHSTTAVDITPKDINKGSALQLLCEQERLDVAEILGVGDTMGDLSFLQLCGQVACPDNAINKIKAMSAFSSKLDSTQGLIAIYEHLHGQSPQH